MLIGRASYIIIKPVGQWSHPIPFKQWSRFAYAIHKPRYPIVTNTRKKSEYPISNRPIRLKLIRVLGR